MMQELNLDDRYNQLYETPRTERKKKKRGLRARYTDIEFAISLVNRYQIKMEDGQKLKEAIVKENRRSYIAIEEKKIEAEKKIISKKTGILVMYTDYHMDLKSSSKKSFDKKVHLRKRKNNISLKDQHIIFNSIDKNYFTCKCYKKINDDKSKKYYCDQSVNYFSRILWTAYKINTDLFKRFCYIPDVAFVLKRIKAAEMEFVEELIQKYYSSYDSKDLIDEDISRIFSSIRCDGFMTQCQFVQEKDSKTDETFELDETSETGEAGEADEVGETGEIDEADQNSIKSNGNLKVEEEMARILWTAYVVDANILRKFCNIPDVFFILKNIEKKKYS